MLLWQVPKMFKAMIGSMGFTCRISQPSLQALADLNTMQHLAETAGWFTTRSKLLATRDFLFRFSVETAHMKSETAAIMLIFAVVHVLPCQNKISRFPPPMFPN
mmetsp:Transcript_72261/g.193270  ORF Transcript_72261/g.193270 Transcript_72261/m.193270 type:complete len:104 (+) Transcript_72261:567-878(+)